MILITGAGGFIGGFLAKRLLQESNDKIRCVDIKPLNEWYQVHDQTENIICDLKEYNNCFCIHFFFNDLMVFLELLAQYKPDCSLSYSGFFHMYDLGVSYTFHFHKKIWNHL